MTIIMDSKVGHLEEEAFKRKERLKNLKRKVESVNKENNSDENSSSNPEGTPLLQPKFRSYKPADENLIDKVNEAKPGDVEALVKLQLDAAKETVVIDELDITNLAPRKPDWDLKRDVAKKLEKLERRTQRAIAELIRERLKTEASTDLAASVAVASHLQNAANNDDD